MNIVFSHYFHDDDNPPVRIVQRLAAGLAERGHAVRVHRSLGPARPRTRPGAMTPDGGGRSPKAWLKGRAWFARALARNAAMYRRDRAVLEEVRPDVVVVRHDAYCASMSLAARSLGVPFVLYADAPAAYETRLYFSGGARWHPPRVVEAVERLALVGATAVTATSHPTADLVRGRGRAGLPVRVIPNAVDPAAFPPMDREARSIARARLGIAVPLVVGFQGGFLGFHGIDRLRELMLALAHRDDVHWLLIGDGPERPGLERAVAGRVRASFLGWRPPAEVFGLLPLIDVAVAPHALVEGPFYLSPLKILEYGAAGCAIVASAQGDIPWLLADGAAGVLLSDPAIPAWARAVEGLLDDPPRRSELGRAARRHILDQFTWDRAFGQYEAVLEQAAATRTSGGRVREAVAS